MESFIYGNEPMDLKLLAIQLWKKLWIWFVAAIVGAFIFGGIYYLKTVTFAPAPSFEADSDFYFTFAEESPGVSYVYYNETTWNSLIYTDEILETTLNYMTTVVDKEFLKKAITLKPMSDVRMLTTVVTTQDSGLSLEIAGALEKSLKDYTSGHVEFTGMTIQTPATTAYQVLATIKTLNAAIAGGVTALLLLFLIVAVYYILDDSIYIQSTFEKRYGINMLGTIVSMADTKTRKNYLSSNDWHMLLENFRLVTKEKSKIAILGIEKGNGAEFFKELMENELTKIDVLEIENKEILTVYEPVLENQSQYDNLRKEEGILLVIPYGEHNGKKIELTIRQLQKQNCVILGAVLNNADPKLTRAYYHSFHERNNIHRKK